MKKLLAVSILVLTIGASSARAAGVSDLGVGVVLGEPIGGTAKLWLDSRSAVDLGLGLSDGNLAFWGDILWHDWTLLPQPTGGKLGTYFGAGPQIRTGDDTRFGIRTLMGVNFLPTGHPLEAFAEVGPMFRLTQGGDVDVIGGVGIRFLFGARK
jgi:hypothetical protein